MKRYDWHEMLKHGRLAEVEFYAAKHAKEHRSNSAVNSVSRAPTISNWRPDREMLCCIWQQPLKVTETNSPSLIPAWPSAD